MATVNTVIGLRFYREGSEVSRTFSEDQPSQLLKAYDTAMASDTNGVELFMLKYTDAWSTEYALSVDDLVDSFFDA